MSIWNNLSLLCSLDWHHICNGRILLNIHNFTDSSTHTLTIDMHIAHMVFFLIVFMTLTWTMTCRHVDIAEGSFWCFWVGFWWVLSQWLSTSYYAGRFLPQDQSIFWNHTADSPPILKFCTVVITFVSNWMKKGKKAWINHEWETGKYSFPIFQRCCPAIQTCQSLPSGPMNRFKSNGHKIEILLE